MRKASAILAFALAIVSTTNAQEQGRSVRIGLKVAPNLSFLKTNDKIITQDGSSLGFNFGLMTDFMMGKNQNYAFATGLFFMPKLGLNYKRTETHMDSVITRTGSARMQMVQIPLTIKLKTNEIGYMTYYGQIGAETAFNVGAKDNYTQVTAEPGSTISVEVKDEKFNDQAAIFRAALLVGAGFEYNFNTNTSAMVGITYSNGFTNAFDKDFGDSKLHYLELSLGMFF